MNSIEINNELKSIETLLEKWKKEYGNYVGVGRWIIADAKHRVTTLRTKLQEKR